MATSTVRGHLRGLEVLQALNRRNYSTALQISRDTGLPRATVYRLLATLVEAGFVSQPSGGELYCLSSSVLSLSSGFDSAAEAVEASRDVVSELSADVGWPVYVHVYDAEGMVLRHMVHSPRELDIPRVGRKVPLLQSSPGRAFLSALPEDQRGEVLRATVGELDGASAREAERVIRDASYYGCGFRDEGMVPRTCSLSVPIRVDDRPAAFVTLVVMRSVMSLNRAIDSYLPRAAAAAAQVESSVKAKRLQPEVSSHI